jgi:hypothetical protein
MPLQYDMTGIDPELAARITQTLNAARVVPDSKLNEVEANVQSNGINFVTITNQIPPGFQDTGAAYMSARITTGFNDTLVIVIPSDRKYLSTGGTELDPGISVSHEVSHYQPGRPTVPTPAGEAAAVQDHIDVGRQLNIPDDQLRPGGTWPKQLNENGISPTLSIDKADAEDVLGHPFAGTQEDVAQLKEAIATGNVTALGDYVGTEVGDRQLAPFDTNSDKIVISFDESGFLSVAHYASIVTDGTLERAVQFDPNDAQPWSSQTSDYAPDGHVTAAQTIDDDGTFSLQTNNPDGTHAITTSASDGGDPASAQTLQYDAAGHLLSETTHNDDGTTTLVTHDAAGAESWATQTASFDLGHNLKSEVIQYDDGWMSERINDLDGAQPWSAAYSVTNPSGQLEWQDVLNDNGSITETGFNHSGVGDWTSYVTNFQDGWQATSETDFYADGSRAEVAWDLNGQNWDTTTNWYDAANHLTYQDTFYDNGSAVETGYNVSGVGDWTSYTAIYDTSLQQTHETDHYIDGTRAEVTYDTAGQTWDTTTNWYDGANHLTYQDTVYDNGTSSEALGGGRDMRIIDLSCSRRDLVKVAARKSHNRGPGLPDVKLAA